MEKIECHTPTPGKKPTRIDRWKYELLKEAILNVLPEEGDGVTFKMLPELVRGQLSSEQAAKIGSIMWYTTTVKLDLECQGLIKRGTAKGPQTLFKTP